ncbi:bifunctional hydroxymethylpyrimidine kinase/phosphomethylpyrimidine kinase, partial [Candidatus Woesearchaeota archaeon]|nr:bifunctional hydroxymethylpyrimidine kinase/phosphomethylpyrimidine kinase [Candidatus Woesearchaeota archaeon]
EAVAGAKFLCYGTLSQRNEVSRSTLMKILQDFKGMKIYDFNYRESIYDWEPLFKESVKYADVLKLNEDEVAMVKQAYGHTGDDRSCALELLGEHNLKYIFITMGEKGAVLFTKDSMLQVPAPSVEVVDTTGCGDAFTAAIAYSLLKGLDEKKMLEYCVSVAAKVATVNGAVPEQLSFQPS